MNHQGISRRQLLAHAGLAGLAGLACPTGAAAAPAWPDQPIKFIVPYAPGATTDLVMRMASRHVTERLGQPVVLESRPGAGGAVGMSALAKSAPDGYTIGATSGSMLIATPMINEGLSFTPADFTFVSLLANVPFILTVPASLPVQNAAELLQYVRANRNKLSYGSVAVGHYAHVAMQEVSESQNADMVHVPYKGEALVLQDLLGGRLQLGFFSPSTIKPMADSGKVRLLGVSGTKRLRALPSVPTLAEQGWLAPVFRMNAGWLGVVAPAKTPAPVLQRLTAEYMAAIRDPQVNAQLSEVGLDPVGSTAEEFATIHQTERALWKGLLLKAGLELKGLH
jgi:tripartite-type tricarboxylate transporter receptor subunit TctC